MTMRGLYALILVCLFAGPVAAQGSVGLAWDAGEFATGYIVQVGGASGATSSTVTVGDVTATSLSFAAPGTYYMRVVAFNPVGASDTSNEVSVAIAAPPAAVDCQVSAWTLASVSPWGACNAGTQTRTETWTRTITTQPANGGLACPALSETRTASQACVMPPPNDPCVSAPLVVTFSTWPNKRNAASYTASHDLASVTWLTRKGNQIYGAAFVDIRGCQTTVLK
jgi:hypothetical protein